MPKENEVRFVIDSEHELWKVFITKSKIEGEVKRTLRVSFENERYDEKYVITDEISDVSLAQLRNVVEHDPDEDQIDLFSK